MIADAPIDLVGPTGRKYLTAEERERFLAAVRKHPVPSVQTLASTLAITGCRASEAIAIRPYDIDLSSFEIRIRTLKRRREHWRAVPVPEDLVRTLDLVHSVRRAQARRKSATQPLWPITRQTAARQVTAIMHAAGIEGPRACPRGLRHSFGIAAVTQGVPLTVIASILGHASITTTAIYTSAIGAEARELVSRTW